MASIFHSTLNLSRVWLITAKYWVDEMTVDETGVDKTGVDELGINLLQTLHTIKM